MGPERAPVDVVLALGSNLGDRGANLNGAVDALHREPRFRVTRVSPWYESEAVGGPPHSPRFWNGVLEGRTSLAPHELLACLQAIEGAFGRERAAEPRNAPRTLDLDILFYGELELDEGGLVIPHPRMEERLFVLLPLARLDPGRRLARSGTSVAERVDQLRQEARGHAREGA